MGLFSSPFLLLISGHRVLSFGMPDNFLLDLELCIFLNYRCSR